MDPERFKKRERNLDWDDGVGSDEELEGLPKIVKRTNRRQVTSATTAKPPREAKTETEEQEDILQGNRISLDAAPNDSKRSAKISAQDIDILRHEVSIMEKDIAAGGVDSLEADEKAEYESKKTLLEKILPDKSQQHQENYLLPDDYVTEDGKIDVQKKALALRHDMKKEKKQQEQEWVENQFRRAEKVNQLSRLKKDEADENDEKQYDFVFDKKYMINYIPDVPEDEMKELQNKIELEELIDEEEKRVQSIEETKKSLPVYQYRDELLDAVEKYQVLIVVGETGSGKTTQLPQYLHEAGYTKGNKMIGCTQPRRVAAVSVATRVADEVGTRLGDKVGYSIRFDEKSSENTVIKYMTDGMLVREFLTDHNLDKYSVMIIDEAHERTLHTDILLGLLKDLLKKRPDLKLIISSATINAKKFSDYFYEAPIFNVPGRRFPVEIYYTEQPESNYLYAAITTVFQIHMSQTGRGDILVFLTGQDEIETMAESLAETCKKLQGQIKEMIICPIYANLQPEQQKKIFEPTPKNARKVVISTNIAETSLTIDGIVYVVDCGFVKENVFNAKSGMESLDVNPCSKASADQRAGRAGRVGPGKCFRLYTKWAYLNELPNNPTPEILRTDLTSVVLLMMTLGVTDLIHFDFMDKPLTSSLAKALELLYALGALNERGELTEVGLKMSIFPTKPMLSKCLLEGSRLQVCDEVLSVIAMLEDSGSLFIRSKENKELAKNAHQRFVSKLGGDHLTLLEIWNQFVASGYSSQWCHDNFLQYRTLQKARNIRKQLLRICSRPDLRLRGESLQNSSQEHPVLDLNLLHLRVMKAITAGYFTQCARLSRTGDSYTTIPRGSTVMIHPSSTLHGAVPPVKLVLYHELVMTSKAFMRHVMPVQRRWLAQYGAHCFDCTGLE